MLSTSQKKQDRKSEKSIKKMQIWFYTNRDRLAWDAEKRRYYLKPEDTRVKEEQKNETDGNRK